jgi:tRNA(His) 5'-end guanylyltransferase
MKKYEESYDVRLPIRMPILARYDGVSFGKYTKKLNKPFDEGLIDAMAEAGIEICKRISGAKIAYIQSDEISVLYMYYQRFDSQPAFSNKLQKLNSIPAGIASSVITEQSPKFFNGIVNRAFFDGRAWVQPEADVTNYFVHRQKDWIRNSVQMLARSLFSQKKIHKKNTSEMQEMIAETGQNWNDLSHRVKYGQCIIKQGNDWVVDKEIPLFTLNRNYIEKLLEVEEK